MGSLIHALFEFVKEFPSFRFLRKEKFCLSVRSIVVDTCEEGDIDGRSAKCSRENNFGRQPSTVPTDARDSCGRSNLYSEVEV